MLKGPLILMFVALTAHHAVDFRPFGALARRLRPLPGISGCCFGAALVHRHRRQIRHHLLHRRDRPRHAGQGDERGGGARRAARLLFVLFWITFWPGSILAGLAAPRVWQARREPGAQFLLAWLVPSWIVFEVVITKLPHYVLPLYPAIAILIAGILEKGGLYEKRWLVRGTAGWFIFPSAIALLVPIAFLLVDRDLGLVAWPTAAAAVILGLFAWRLYEVDGAERSLLRGMWPRWQSASPSTASPFRRCRPCSPAPGGDGGERAAIAPIRSLPRPMPIRSRAWCSCSAPARASPTAPAPPNS